MFIYIYIYAFYETKSVTGLLARALNFIMGLKFHLKYQDSSLGSVHLGL